ncbi:MAG: HEPN domain-containing protein, partial [Nitrososphaerota archaeon]
MYTVDEAEFSRWIRSAILTLRSAKRDYDGGDYNWTCFKAHQSAE